MRGKRIGIFSVCVLLSGFVFAEEAEKTEFSGSVKGPGGNPVAGAELELYLLNVNQASMSYQVHEMGRTKSDAGGKFLFTVDTPQGIGYSIYCCLAKKEGLSCGWGTLIGGNQTVFDITLTEPQKMTGFVYTPDGTPVPEAEVRLVVLAMPGEGEQVMFGIEPVEEFATTTCQDGRFDFTNLPTGATAEFLIRKPGRGTLYTLDTSVNPESGLTYKAGQTEIRLTMQDGFTIAGKVVKQDDQKPVEGVPVIAVDTALPINLITKPQKSAEDGSFVFSDLAPGEYRVGIQDDNWIAEPLTIMIGDANVGDAVLQLAKGGLVEIKVIDSATEEPVSGAYVSLRSEQTGLYQQFAADENGVAKKQLLPDTYRVSAYASGYRSAGEAGTVVVENNKTAKLTVQLGGQSKIAGKVVGPDGKPFEGAEIQMVPNFGGRPGNITSDENGRFKIAWDPEQMGWTEGEFYLLATCQDENLAGVELIGVDTKEATIKLRKGVEITGNVLNAQSEPISGARVYLTFCGSRFSASFGRETKTDDDGRYSFGALAPEYRYSVNISHEGYGTGRQDVELTAEASSTEAKDIVLRLADQKLSGVVVDIDGTGLANVQLHCYGEGQPNINARTDEDGKFAFDNVCPGEINISANYNRGSEYMYGSVSTEGGAEDVKIVLTPQGGSRQYVPKQAPSLVGKLLPDLTAGGITLPADANSILLFAWDMNQRPSRYFLKQLADKADLLDEKNVTVVLLNTSPIDKEILAAWLNDNQINYPCGVMGEDAEDRKFKMGVQSLPWLILTDADHNVIAEGFSVEALEEKLKTL